MNKKKLSKVFLVFILLVGLVFAVNSLENTGNIAIAKSKKKTKWQLNLEKRQVPISFWRKYLPKVTRKEYKKALKKYNLSIQNFSQGYLLHQNVTTTFFWVGEEAGPENGYIPNNASAWDDKWKEHFGGIDDPNSRNGYSPAAFTPLENPFYFALPYNDFDGNGNRRGTATQMIPWASEKTWSADESMCKNRWIKIIKGNAVAYAQWEDVGPFEENDTDYVFGSSAPHSSVNNHAGLDVSPAVRDYLGLGGMDATNWQFVDANDVPDGPWKQTVTTSNIHWE
jgi:hypothetical protein